MTKIIDGTGNKLNELIDKLCEVLSEFEKIVFLQYLENKSFKEIHRVASKKTGKKIRMQAISDALLRIRHKARKEINISEVEDMIDSVIKVDCQKNYCNNCRRNMQDD